ncbi:MAG: hypothetical protein KAW12_26945 [Candidatus Aminicenantes bacterium]|nr:hypothetical protein [Candidatus Aminicenantes bacterium]
MEKLNESFVGVREADLNKLPLVPEGMSKESDDVITVIQALVTKLDAEYYKAEKKEDREQLILAINATYKRLDAMSSVVFDRNTNEYKKLMKVFNKSEKEVEKFRNGQSGITGLTSFLMGLLNQVDALLYGLRRDQLLN